MGETREDWVMGCGGDRDTWGMDGASFPSFEASSQEAQASSK